MKYPIEWLIEQIKKIWEFIESIPAILLGYVKKSGDTMTGLLVLSGDPVVNKGAATKDYVDKKYKTFIFSTPSNPWTIVHNEGKPPSSCRVLVQFPTVSAEFVEKLSKVTDQDPNTTVISHGSNYQGKAILVF